MPGKICLGDIIYLIYLFLLSLYIGPILAFFLINIFYFLKLYNYN